MRPTDFCHPNELRVLHTSCVPSSARHFRSGDAPRILRLRTAWLRESSVSRRCETASADRDATLTPGWMPHGVILGVGVFLPTALMRSSLWHPCRAPISILTPPLPSQGLPSGRVLGFWPWCTGRRMFRSAEDHSWTFRVTGMLRDDPRWLLSAGDPS